MGTGWIAVDKTLPYKPEVIAIAKALSVTKAEAILACIKLWAWADDITTDGSLGELDMATIDEVAGQIGFARAMLLVGWLAQQDGIMFIPNWCEWNFKSAKARVLAARRQRIRRKET